MNSSIYKQLYVSKKEPLVIEYTQGSNLLPISFEIMDWTIPTSSTAQIYVEKPSGALVFNAATVSGQNIIVQPTTQMTAEIGANKGQLLIVNGDKVLVSFGFILKVFESIIDSSAIESQDEFTALEEALSAVSDVVTHTELQSKGAANKGVYFDSDGSAQPMTYAVNSDVPAKPVISQSVNVSSLPMTVNVTGMTANHKAIWASFGTPSAQTADWTVTPANGSFTISGSISGSTSLDLVFVYIPA